VALSWFTAEVDGQAKYLRVWLEERGVSYVMAIRRCDTFTTSVGEQRADALIAELPARSWQRLSAGAGAHGPPEYHWARIAIPGAAKPAAGTGAAVATPFPCLLWGVRGQDIGAGGAGAAGDHLVAGHRDDIAGAPLFQPGPELAVLAVRLIGGHPRCGNAGVQRLGQQLAGQSVLVANPTSSETAA
jgi:hypothetical protein